MIVPIDQCYRAFWNAHTAVSAGNWYSLSQEHTAWVETYGVAPLLDKNGYPTWESLQFKSEQDYTMFLLKWS